jgi:hypothetical protein
MDLVLFAQPNNAAFKAGMMVGIVFAVLICGAIPIAVGSSKGQPILGIIGALCAGGTAVLLGCLGGLPVAALFSFIIVLVSGREGTSRKRRRPRRYDYDDEDDDYRPRRRSRRDSYDIDDDDNDDRPIRRRSEW